MMLEREPVAPPWRCCHIVPCTDELTCRRLEKEACVRIAARNAEWKRSAWGQLPFFMREGAVYMDLLHALGGIDDANMARLREVLGAERFRLLLNACERVGLYVDEGTDSKPTVLP